MGLATTADIKSLKADINALHVRFDASDASVNSRFDEVMAILSPMSPTLAELGRRALVSDCAGAKLRVLPAHAHSTVFRLRLDGIDGGLKLAGERYGLMPPSVGETLATAALCVVDRAL